MEHGLIQAAARSSICSAQYLQDAETIHVQQSLLKQIILNST